MDNNTLVTLVGFDIDKGKNVILDLDKAGLEVSSAFWFYFSDVKEWRLLLAVPLVDSEGPKKIYSQIQNIIKEQPNDESIPLWSIGIISPSHPINQLLRAAIKTGEKSIAGIRFSSSVINGVLIEDAYIYRLN